jgi:16S rRNA (cytidine1402-2'-O)-methyltransferase
VAAGYRVVSLPGPSAALAALTTAGLATDTFLFAGFLPPKQAARRARLARLQEVPGTLVLFEAPLRLADSLQDIAQVLGPRDAAVARELTKLHEEVRRGTPAELARWAAEAKPRGEMVVLVGPPLPQVVTDEVIAAKLTPMLSVMSLSDAAKAAADDLGVAKARAYDIGIALKRPSEV